MKYYIINIVPVTLSYYIWIPQLSPSLDIVLPDKQELITREVEPGTVCNIIVDTEDSTYLPPEGYSWVMDEGTFDIGDTYTPTF